MEQWKQQLPALRRLNHMIAVVCVLSPYWRHFANEYGRFRMISSFPIGAGAKFEGNEGEVLCGTSGHGSGGLNEESVNEQICQREAIVRGFEGTAVLLQDQEG